MESKRKMSTSHFSIFDYWKDKCITEQGNVEIEIGYEGHDETKANIDNSIAVIQDWGEPECFACGKWTGVSVENPDDDLVKVWNNIAVRHQLERAHIIPHALGGEDSPKNLFCLCKRCHRDSPDTIYPKEFFKWVYKRRNEGSFYKKIFDKAVEECKKAGVSPLFMNPKTVFENPFTVMNTHGSVVVESSYVAALVGSATETQNKIKEIIEDALFKNNDLGIEPKNIEKYVDCLFPVI